MESLATRVPIIVLQRVEEIFPAVREGMVSAVCMCAQESFLSIYSLGPLGQKNKKPMVLLIFLSLSF
jgi:hypothetical protein